jgi:hypothetical protein
MHKETENKFDETFGGELLRMTGGVDRATGSLLYEQIDDEVKSFINEHFIDKKKLEEEIERLAVDQIEMFNGKLPFVVFNGKADEEEKVGIYRQALQDLKDRLL